MFFISEIYTLIPEHVSDQLASPLNFDNEYMKIMYVNYG